MTEKKKLHYYTTQELINVLSDFKDMTKCKSVEIVHITRKQSKLVIDGKDILTAPKTLCVDFLKAVMHIIRNYYNK